MNCLDCALTAAHGEPLGTCIYCGAAVCAKHAVIRQTAPASGRTALLQRQLSAPPRTVRCQLCDQVRNPSPVGDVPVDTSAKGESHVVV
jgi:hypothetical protein